MPRARIVTALLTGLLTTGALSGNAAAAPSPETTVSGTAAVDQGRGLAPVPGARVSSSAGPTTTADQDGRFSLPLPEGGAVTVRAPGLPTWTIRDLSGARGPVDVTALLDRPRELSAAGLGRMGNRTADRTPTPVPGECTGHESDLEPPATIRVLLFGAHDHLGWGVPGTELGVHTVPFRDYVADVLPGEWHAAWPAESLNAGAIAVKGYAWYWTQYWRGGEHLGQCFDVDDSIAYQRYVPGNRHPLTDAAVDATWTMVAHREGEVFSTGYRATLTGDNREPCGAGRETRPDLLSQWGTHACALEGRIAPDMISLYYPGAVLG